ncbi:HD-GYP domain-containing protein [Treponema medium]|uniref:HD-GYP domain-containing protein n=1 Tax=Treponema medium TaxID=58231 RepID=UPI0019811CA1|nr:HD-GYP domain-containing protein [Treponema medium]QSH92215.1 HD-GYP domain-containing protein [Treponema medium]QSH92353.1 HD-GYP domain-containing protein [Treponema medium]
MNTLKLLELKPPVYFTEDVYIDKKFLLFTRESCFTDELKRLLSEWQFTLLYTKGTVTETNPQKKEKKNKEKTDTPEKGQVLTEQKLSGELVEKTYQKFYAFTNEVYEAYRNRQSLNTENVIAKMKELCTFVQENRQAVLILQSIMPYNVDNFLVTHSLRSAVYAIVVGMELKMQNHQLVELATAALMHEIGLIHIAEDIYSRAGELSDEERKYLHVHPVLSCKILKKAKFPLPVCLGTLDHHERENGTGYPQKLTGEKISLYGKIIAVVCSYEAMTGERKYKKADDPATGLLNVLRREPSQYDEEVLKALLNALSFFPIGSFVYLSNNTVAQVIDNNSEDPRFPVVRVIDRSAKAAFSEAIRTAMDGIRIMRPARKEEWVAALSKGKKKA